MMDFYGIFSFPKSSRIRMNSIYNVPGKEVSNTNKQASKTARQNKHASKQTCKVGDKKGRMEPETATQPNKQTMKQSKRTPKQTNKNRQSKTARHSDIDTQEVSALAHHKFGLREKMQPSVAKVFHSLPPYLPSPPSSLFFNASGLGPCEVPEKNSADAFPVLIP